MMKPNKLQPDQELYYFEEVARYEDYYAAEGHSIWMGAGAEQFGLAGKRVEPHQLRALCRGFDPHDHEKQLVQLQRQSRRNTRQPGWDLTLSMPKSVSVLWSQLGPQDRKLIEAALQKAVADTLKDVERIARTRTGHAGRNRESVSLFFAVFMHHLSREGDPHLHAHAIVPNVGIREDGSSGTIVSRDFFTKQLKIGELLRRRVAQRIAEINIPLQYSNGSYRIPGLPATLERHCSTRSQKIDEVCEERGWSTPAEIERAVLLTRPPKVRQDPGELEQRWKQAGLEHGFGRAQAERLLHGPQPQRDVRRAEGDKRRAKARSHDHARQRHARPRAAGEQVNPRARIGSRAVSGNRRVARSADAWAVGLVDGNRFKSLEKALEGFRRDCFKVVAASATSEGVTSLESELDVQVRTVPRTLAMLGNTWKRELRFNLSRQGLGYHTSLDDFYRPGRLRLVRNRRYLDRKGRKIDRRLRLDSKSLLVVDDAHKLSDGQLRRLACVADNSRAKLLLRGPGKELKARLRDLQLLPVNFDHTSGGGLRL